MAVRKLKIQLERDGEYVEVKRLEVLIGEVRYAITESNDGKLVINKPDMGDEPMQIHPQYGNQIGIV